MWLAPLLGSVLLPLAAGQFVFSTVDTCPGDVTLEGYGVVSLVNAAWNVPGEQAGDVAVQSGAVMPTINGRTYFANTCNLGGVKSASDYLSLQLLGKALRYTTDISGASCGCNAAFYLTAMSHNEQKTDCQDWYCDANSVCGQPCVEIDIQEANKRAWHSTLHSKKDKNGLGMGYGGGAEGPQGWSGPRDFTGDEYGPGASCIDTRKPFQVTTAFPVDQDGGLQDVKTVLSQEGHDCTLSVTLAGYSGEAELSAALATGLTPVISYWNSNDMLWMDGIGKDQEGPCEADHAGDCAYNVKFYDFSVANIGEAQPKAPPTFQEQQKANAEAWATQQASQTATPTPVPVTTTTAAATFSDASLESRYKFGGFATADEARNSCGEGKRLAMPKSKDDYDTMLVALNDAMLEGSLSQHWPSNTIWLGGMWNPAQQAFTWDDGDVIYPGWFNWGEGQPSETAENHGKEPWLCMLLDGKVHDSEPHFKFGVMCEEGESPKSGPAPAGAGGGVGSAPSAAESAEPQDGEGYCCLLSTSEKEDEQCSTCLYLSEPGNWCAASSERCGQCGERTTWCLGEMPTTTTGVPAPTAAPAPAPIQIAYNGFTNAPQCDCAWLIDDDCSETEGCATACRVINNKPCVSTTTGWQDTTAETTTTEEPGTTTTMDPERMALIKASEHYVFQGFADSGGATALCKGSGGSLPMPKTVEAHKALGLALKGAIADGKMSGNRSDSPNSTIWLAGRWSVIHSEWEWDDGTFAEIVRWAPGQPNGPQWNRQEEPLMVMTYDEAEGGLVHDKGVDNSYFGVFCKVEEIPEARHDDEAVLPDDADEFRKGYCCMSSKDSSDSCGTCRVWAHPSHNGFCSLSRSECGHCGSSATWCSNLTEAFVRKFVLPQRALRRAPSPVEVADGRQLLSGALGLLLVAGAMGGARKRWLSWSVRRSSAQELGVVAAPLREGYRPCDDATRDHARGLGVAG